MNTFFDELMESVQQMDEIVRGERPPSREFHVDALQIKETRKHGNDQPRSKGLPPKPCAP
ncbi:Cro/Cl family transcriptional regulator [Pseudomonas fluorescens HK44]|uniref:Cro/Cl family transcriptional regulator n=1 Tax=Pseudomonas fluorescens HK44 TaxID=1042209 RepID=A0A010REI3_PSEFL|nr:Cro/Cl family transcriptional regulator [Pseudomonas fluorescens HK44]